MICTGCHFTNTEGAGFCGGCGVKLAEYCAACGTATVAGALFCHNCGDIVGARETSATAPTLFDHNSEPAPLAPEPRPADQTSTISKLSTAELRHVTVLFVDIVDSTGLSQRLDLERYREVFASFRRYVERLSPEFDGHIAQFMGDGAMIFFGYPVAREDAVACAIYCGMEMVKTAADLGGELSVPDIEIGLRVTVNSGSVVVDESVRADGSFSKDVFGDVPNIAERLKPLAEPGDVVVSTSTMRLVANTFSFADLGEHQVKGIERPVRAFRVEGRAHSNRANAMIEISIIGRSAEIGLLTQRWASAVDGDSQMVLLSGEAGIGKSALVQMLRNKASAESGLEILLTGTAVHRNSAYRVLRSGFEVLLGVEEAEDDLYRQSRIAQFLRAEGLDHGRFAPALERLLACSADEPVRGSVESTRRELNSALCAIIARLSRNVPLLIVAEDLHWIDPSSLEFLTDFVFVEDPGNWFLIATSRPNFSPIWLARPNMTLLTIGRLSRRDTIQLIEVVAGRPVPDEVVEKIVERTDGVPLFVEELTKTVIESGLLTDDGERYLLKGLLPELAIPASLQDSLMARLDRLAAVKGVAQIAAAIGRRFPLALLRQVAGGHVSALDEALAKLTDAELIFRLRSYPDAEFEFKHALVQDTAYHSLLRSARQEWHQRIAEAIEANFPQFAIDDPEVLAHHWTEAQNFARSEQLWAAAGQVALARSANLEAIGHFRQALKCLNEQPQGHPRDQRELELLISLAVPLASSRGYADAKVREIYARAEVLGAELGADASIFPIVYGIFRSRMIGGDQTSALDYARRVNQIAKRSGDRGHLGAAHRSMGAALFYSGAPAEALPRFNALEALDLTEAELWAVLSYDVVDLGVARCAYGALVQWTTGSADRARESADEAIRRADDTGHLFSRALSRAFGAWTYDFCGDRETSGVMATEALVISKEGGLDFWIGWAEVMVAAARTGEDVPAEIDRGIENWLATGSRLGLSYFLWLKARALIGLGAAAEAEVALDAAIEELDRSGEEWWRPEVLRLRAQVTDDRDRAAELIDKALMLALGMHADALALRAALDRAELPGNAPRSNLKSLLARVEPRGVTEDTRRARILLASCQDGFETG